MSSSVPDMREVKQSFIQRSSRTRLLRSHLQSYSSPSSPLVKPPGGATDSRSGLKSTLTSQLTGSEHRLSAPSDCTDWASSQGLFHGPPEDHNISPQTARRTTASMEPEEQVRPEPMATGSDPQPQEASQDPQVDAELSPRLFIHQLVSE